MQACHACVQRTEPKGHHFALERKSRLESLGVLRRDARADFAPVF
jgi:hypothetical protein